MSNPPRREDNTNRRAEFKTIPPHYGAQSGFLSTGEYKEKYGWVSPYPYGHKNWSPAAGAPDPRYVNG